MTEIRQPGTRSIDERRDADIDALRERLKSLGYLDAGVDRFVLAPARQARTPASLALLSSLRIGALGGLLLGPAAVVGFRTRLPGLVTGLQDALVLAVYLFVLFAAAITAAAFASSLIVALLARRAGGRTMRRVRGLAVAAGAAVTLLCLAYLTLWWQTASGGLGWSSPLRTATALAIAAAISLVLGHAVTVTALAVMVASSPTGPPIPGVPGTSWRASLISGIVAFLGAAVLLVVSTPGETAAASSAPLTVIPSGVRVRVLAIDGIDSGVFDELRAAGRLPAFDSIFQGAVASLRLPQTEDDRRDPARAWTTIATGQPVERHGVYGLETRRVAGLHGRVPLHERFPAVRALAAATDLFRLTHPSIASGSERQEKTFWEVASAAGLRTIVVNWWATWPARADAGIVLSDRAALRLERGGELNAEIAPVSVYERLGGRWSSIKGDAARLGSQALEISTTSADLRPLLQRSIELDADQLVLAAEVSERNTDLTVIYLPGLDIAQHALLNPDAAPAAAPSALAARLDAIRDYYVALDRLVGSLLPRPADEMLFVITAPGRVAGGAVGRLAAAGPHIRAAATVDGGVTDVSPTILYALGVPVSRALAGAPRLGLFAAEFTERYPVRFVDTYGRPASSPLPSHGRPLDQEMLDRLRSLGYLR